ncbi:MAG: FKBP-type peptidyl-prolyl cis-trans isomerase [Robiginitomaculum sp.]
MRKLVLTGLMISTAAFAACNNNTAPKTPKTEAEAASALKTARDNMAKFRTCPKEQVLHDLSSYSNEWPDPKLEQKEWFEANGKRKGVVTTDSGLQYSVNKKGIANGAMPKPVQTVRVNYHGLFLDGKIFDSSYDRGQDIEFPLNGVIKGWTQGVGLMRPCDAWTFYIPSDLAYGPKGKGSIPPATPLIFHVQLLAIAD